jgi:hypothetical protein
MVLGGWKGLELMLGWGGCRAVEVYRSGCVELGGEGNGRFGGGMGRSECWISAWEWVKNTA